RGHEHGVADRLHQPILRPERRSRQLREARRELGRVVVAVRLGERGEPLQIDETEGGLDARHAWLVIFRIMAHDRFDPEYVFSHHHATPEKLAHYEAIHAAAKHFAGVVLEHV